MRRTSTGTSVFQDERHALEDRSTQAAADLVDGEHTALRAFGPHPPLAPILDEQLVAYFASRLDLAGAQPEVSVEVVDLLPDCDRCGPQVLARHASVLRRRDGRLLSATLCTACHWGRTALRVSTLTSVRLVLLAEVGDPVRARVDEHALRQGALSPWANDGLEPEWVRSYRACGFGGPDANGRMSREIFGESVEAALGSGGGGPR